MFSNNNRGYTIIRSKAKETASFMSQVYGWMTGGIFISGLTAYAIASNPQAMMYLTQSRGAFLALFVFQIVAVIALSGWVQRMSVFMASAVFILYATLVGVTFSTLFLLYTMESISLAFFATSTAFAGLSIFARVTKRDLGPLGSFCMIGLFGMIAVVLISMLVPSMMTNSLQLTLAVIGVLVFAGLTAYDTQRIKSLQYQFNTADSSRKGAIYGALILYLDFINLFINILRLMGDRR